MMRCVVSIFWCMFLLLLPELLNCHFTEKEHPKLLIISFDGFRHDYIDLAAAHQKNVSAFRMMMKRGVIAKYSQGIFPTYTYPSHMSMATGLYPEYHGITENNFYDPKIGIKFTEKMMNNFDNRLFDTGHEPIWITNERRGFRSAVINWYGFNAMYQGRMPTYSNVAYQEGLNFKSSVDRMISWLEKKHTTLGMLYHEEPDEIGHISGPNSQELLNEIEKANSRLSYVFERVGQSHVLRHHLNIMLVSDHGMATLTADRAIDMDQIFPNPGELFHDYSSFFSLLFTLWPKEGKLDTILSSLRGQQHLKFWKKEDVPAEFHYSKSPRIAPVIILADDGWWMKTKLDSFLIGSHGYNNSNADMHPIFMASGPAFKRNLTLPSVHMIDYYNIMCSVLGLKPNPNNGSMDRIQVMLAPKEEDEALVTSTFITYVLVLVFVMVIGGVFSLAALQQIKYHYIRRRGRPPQIAFYDLQRMENGEHTTALLKEGDLDDEELSDRSVDLSVAR